MPHPAALDPDALRKQCDVRFTRRSGPGGQNRNKVETAVILTHRPTGLVAEANEERSQARNGEEALRRLRLSLAVQIREVAAAEPSPLWRSRSAGGKLRVNPDHDDYPALLAEALDHLAATGFDPKLAATPLGCSPTQLVKLLKGEPRALLAANAARAGLGLHALR